MSYSKIRSVNSDFFEASTPELEAFLSSFGVLAVELPNADSCRSVHFDSQGLRHGLSDDAGFIKFGQGTREHQLLECARQKCPDIFSPKPISLVHLVQT
jgi:hypothetical protein